MTDESEVLFERRGAAGIITLNRPKALNALTHGMCLAMKTQLDVWAKDVAIKTVIVRDLRVHQILEGTNEIMRLIVSRKLIEGAR